MFRALYRCVFGLSCLAWTYSAPALATGQCRDGIDNDADGLVDALIETSSNQTEQLLFNRDPFGIRAYVNSQLGYTQVDNGSALLFDWITAHKICQIGGYEYASHIDCVSVYDGGRCGWHSCHDDALHFWNGSSWVRVNACDIGNHWLTTLICKGRRAPCSDGIDNDGDGKRDFPADNGCASPNDQSEHPHDPACTSPDSPTEFEQCRNGIDDDGDSLIDAGDPGCWTDRFNPATYNPNRNNEAANTTQCQDRVDNDHDGKIDLADPGCVSASDDDEGNNSPMTECLDAVDNDRDTLIDAQDPGCWDNPQQPHSYNPLRDNEGAATTQCRDAIDNDQDGLTDAQDPGCWDNRLNPLSYNPARNNEADATTQCQDLIDNDSDGRIDLADPGCIGIYDDNEFVPITQCMDTIDNDGDTLIDALDPGCWDHPNVPSSYNASRDFEGAATSQCQDRRDNDGDQLIDLQDPGCVDAKDNDEASDDGSGRTQCWDGRDNDSDALVDAQDPGCWDNPRQPQTYNPQRTNEGAATSECQDTIDNDGDQLIDSADPGCWGDPDEPRTYDPRRYDESADNEQDDGTGPPDPRTQGGGCFVGPVPAMGMVGLCLGGALLTRRRSRRRKAA